MTGLRALSLRQPWAWLVVNGYKDIENRSWRTTHRGPLLIHASASKEDFNADEVEDIWRGYRVRVPEVLDIGGIVGIVDVVDCVDDHRSKWFGGEWGWVLANPRRLPFRECKGFVKFFVPKLDLSAVPALKKKKKKKFPAKRKFNLRRDASVASGQHAIERVFGLPEGSVRFHLPSGRRARSDKAIGALLTDWGW